MDIDCALDATEEAMAAFWPIAAWPDAQPFSGGILTDWPARLSDELTVCRREHEALKAFLLSEREEVHGG